MLISNIQQFIGKLLCFEKFVTISDFLFCLTVYTFRIQTINIGHDVLTLIYQISTGANKIF